MQFFKIEARSGRARAGTITTAHGDVATPAFIPLASKATVKSLTAREVEALGYQMVLGNTYHLFLSPGHELIAAQGGLHRFMAWRKSLITDSGGFQVFSMGHGRVADEIKGRARTSVGEKSQAAILAIEEEGVRFRSYIDGAERFIGPETSMEVQAALGPDIALAFDECTPYHAGRDYTASSMERTHRWLDRCIEWRAKHAPPEQRFFGIVQGGTYRDLRIESAQRVAQSPVDGVAIGGSLGQEKGQIYQVAGWAIEHLPDGLPRHLLGIGEIDDLLACIELGIDLFDCAMPTRLARHGMAVVPDPESRWRLDLGKAPAKADSGPLAVGCSCTACTDHSRAYLHYLVRAGEMTAVRLLTEHNLFFMARLMEGARAEITKGSFTSYRESIMAGSAPWELLPPPAP